MAMLYNCVKCLFAKCKVAVFDYFKQSAKTRKQLYVSSESCSRMLGRFCKSVQSWKFVL